MTGTAAGAAKRAARAAGAATPTDRQKPRVRRSTAAELDQVPDAQVEALGEDEAADDGSLDLEFDGETFHITSPADWRQSAMTGLRNGDFNTWAAGAMDADSAKLFTELDLTNRQANDFMAGFDEQFQARYGTDPTRLQQRLGLSPSTSRRSR